MLKKVTQRSVEGHKSKMITALTSRRCGLLAARSGVRSCVRTSGGAYWQVAHFSKLKDSSVQTPSKDQTWKEYIQSVIENKEINTIPNIITMSRIAASPLLSVAIAYDMKAVALGGCVLFGFSDWLDGYLAKKLNQKTVLGAFLDPMADKVMIGALTVGLVAKGLLPFPLACVILGRDAVLIGATFTLRAIQRPAGSHFFDTTDSATFNIIPSELSKVNTGVQFALLSATLSQFAFGVPSVALLDPLWWITATTTISSGLMYLDGSGRKTITRTVKEKVAERVAEPLKIVSKHASVVEQRVKEVMSKSSKQA